MKLSTFLTLAPALSLLACNPWDNLPHDGWSQLDEVLWSDEVVSATDGLYVRLPHAGQLVRIQNNGEYAAIDLDGATPTDMALGPDDQTVVVFGQWPECESDEEDIVQVSDCPDEDLVTNHELALVRDGALVGSGPVAIPGHYNRLAFSPWDEDSGFDPVAVAYLDYEGGGIDVDGILNLTEVLFVNLRDSDTERVSVGFSANNVLFTADGTKAAVLSRSQVVLVDLISEHYEVLVTYNLTLDADQEVDPLGAAITPDDRYLLMSVEGSGDLYAMDLDNESINIIDLDSPPAAMAIDSSADRTALVYSNRAQVDILEHDYFDVESIALDEPCNAIAETDEGVAVLYNDTASTHDVYRLDLDDGDLTEYRVANPVTSLQLTPDNTFAVALMRQEWDSSSSGIDQYYDEHWGLSVLDLSDDDNIDLVLEAQPVGMAFSEGEGGKPYALLLQSGLDTLVKVDLWNEAAITEVELSAPPTGIGALPNGDFYITHEAALGLVSFLDPDTDELLEVYGFAAEGLFSSDELPRQPASEEE